MWALWAMACLSWRRLFRDRLALAATFVLPIAVGVFLMGTYTDGSRQPLGVVVPSDDTIGDELVRRLDESGLFEITRYDDREALERGVLQREVAAGVVLPADVTGPVTDIDLVGTPEIAAPGGIRALVESAVAETAAAVQVGRALEPGRPADEAFEAGRAALARVPSPADEASTQDREDDSDAWALLGTVVLFVFMNTMAASAQLPDLQQLGILSRIRSTPASSAQIGVGLGLGLASYGLFLALMVFAVGWVAFGVTWVSPLVLVAVAVVVSLAAGGLGLVTGTFLAGAENGPMVLAPLGFTLGALAGCLWPLDIVGRPLQIAARLTPQNWAVEALRSAGMAGEDTSALAGKVAVLAVMALLLYALGVRRAWRMVQRA